MEKENYTAYDLEREEPKKSLKPVETVTPEKRGETEKSEKSGETVESEKPEKGEESAVPDEPSVADEAGAEIARMVGEMGAEKVLEIIRGNRNAAIDQIVKELEAESDYSMQSGTSIASRYNSIFELAAMA